MSVKNFSDTSRDRTSDLLCLVKRCNCVVYLTKLCQLFMLFHSVESEDIGLLQIVIRVGMGVGEISKIIYQCVYEGYCMQYT